MDETAKEVEDWHTLSSSYRRKFNRHTLFVEEFLRYRDEHDENEQKQYYDYDENPYERLDWSDFTHRQLANMLQAGYIFDLKKMQFRVGGIWTYLHDFVRNKELDNEFKTNYRYITPSTDISYSPNWKFNLRLSYTMNKQIPSITALNPYVYKNVAGELTYGNPDLKPQTSNSLSLSSNLQIGKLRFYGELTNSFSKDLMLRHSFLKDGMLHNTTDNMGKRYDFNIRTNLSSKFTRTSWARIETTLYYTDYKATDSYKRNKDYTFSTNATLEQELPWYFFLTLGGGYNSKWIYLQGKGGENYYYNVNLEKSFPRQRLTVSFEARSFIPVHYTSEGETRSEGYYSMYRSRYYHASFSFNVRWRFGRLKAETRSAEGKVEYDDIKRDYGE